MESEDKRNAIIAIVIGIIVVTFIIALALNDYQNRILVQTCLQHNTVKECDDGQSTGK